jgi:hypothetical protein
MAAVVQKPKTWFLAAALLVFAAGGSLAVAAPYQVALANSRSQEMIDRMTASLSEEQAQAVRDRAKPTTASSLMLMGGATALVVMALGWVGRGAIVHFSSVAMGGHSKWASSFAVSVWAMVPYVVRDLVQAVFVLLNHQVVQHAGLGFLVTTGNWLQDSRSMVYSLLSNTDPFALWHLVLLGIGISVATQVGRVKGFMLGLVIFAVFLGLKLLPVALQVAVGGQLGA